MRTCPSCHNSVEANLTFCPNCGTRLGTGPQGSQGYEGATQAIGSQYTPPPAPQQPYGQQTPPPYGQQTPPPYGQQPQQPYGQQYQQASYPYT